MLTVDISGHLPFVLPQFHNHCGVMVTALNLWKMAASLC